MATAESTWSGLLTQPACLETNCDLFKQLTTNGADPTEVRSVCIAVQEIAMEPMTDSCSLQEPLVARMQAMNNSEEQ